MLQPILSFAEERVIDQEEITKPETAETSENQPTEGNNDNTYGESEIQPEYEKQAESWRFRDGQIINQESNDLGKMRMSRAAFTPWSKVEGNFISSDGSVIVGATKKGIDVSEFQGKIDWAKVKASDVDFAVIRCGYGSDYTSQDDAQWEYNVSECERLGIPYGVYLYSYANSTAKAKSEAQHTLRLLKGHKPAYPVYYDLEDSIVSKAGRTNIINYADIYCSAIEAKGYKAGIYANLDWWNNKLNSSSLNKYDKWVAQWYKKCTYTEPYKLWQCTSDGYVPGINGRVDLNFAFGKADTGSNTNGGAGGRWITDENGQIVFQKVTEQCCIHSGLLTKAISTM